MTLMASTNEGMDPENHRQLQLPSGSIFTGATPPEYAPFGVKPVSNYSIQTGEEFAFEFLRDRANPRKQATPNAAGDQNSLTSYTDTKSIFGINHRGSECGSGVSVLVTGENKRVKEFSEKESYKSEGKSFYEPGRSVQKAPSDGGASRGSAHGYTSSEAISHRSLMKMKVLCSSGGKILPRPRDGKLRYVGGDTRIISIHNDMSWWELLQKTSTVCSQAHTIKYQLPGEDLDALVSVSCDEDVQNMMEECNLLGREESQKLRLFLFSPNELSDAHVGTGIIEGGSEIQYVFAVNGLDMGPMRSSNDPGFDSTSGIDLDQFLGFNIDKDRQASGVQMASI